MQRTSNAANEMETAYCTCSWQELAGKPLQRVFSSCYGPLTLVPSPPPFGAGVLSCRNRSGAITGGWIAETRALTSLNCRRRGLFLNVSWPEGSRALVLLKLWTRRCSLSWSSSNAQDTSVHPSLSPVNVRHSQSPFLLLIWSPSSTLSFLGSQLPNEEVGGSFFLTLEVKRNMEWCMIKQNLLYLWQLKTLFLHKLQVFYKTCLFILVKLWKENGVGSCIFGQYKITLITLWIFLNVSV